MLALDAINEAGGVLGKRVIPVFMNGETDAAIFAERAR
jgi:ABC-type branched-subunit amino acid transport system substrate-binding protein